MQIDIQTRGFTLTESLLRYSEQRLLFSMSYWSDYIDRVVIRLSDINGPRGGTDKRCHLQIVMPNLPNIVVEDTECDMYAAIDRSIDRARRTVARKVDRQQTLLKQRHPIVFEEELKTL